MVDLRVSFALLNHITPPMITQPKRTPNTFIRKPYSKPYLLHTPHHQPNMHVHYHYKTAIYIEYVQNILILQRMYV